MRVRITITAEMYLDPAEWGPMSEHELLQAAKEFYEEEPQYVTDNGHIEVERID